MIPKRFSTIYGVDFSGAKLAGRAIWVARTEPAGKGSPRLKLLDLDSLERLCGTAERGPALQSLVDRIAASDDALWAIDCPLGMPSPIIAEPVRVPAGRAKGAGPTNGAGAAFRPGRGSWPGLLRFFRDWPHDGYDIGVRFLNRARALGGANHLPRRTDSEAKAPFSCYHYRIIYQTYHGIRDVLLPLLKRGGTLVLPFQAARTAAAAAARRVLVEACPSSTLKRLKLPHQNYKQPEGGPLTPRRRRTRRTILAGLAGLIDIPPLFRRRIMRNGGGDALDAVIAAVGAHRVWTTADLEAVHRDARYRREGYIYG